MGAGLFLDVVTIMSGVLMLLVAIFVSKKKIVPSILFFGHSESVVDWTVPNTIFPFAALPLIPRHLISLLATLL